MLDTIHTAILESGGKNLFFTLSKLSSEEVFSIWDTVSEFVEKQLSMNKGVSIPGLGTFSFLRQKLEIGANKHILVQRPVFLLSEKLVQIHGLKRNKVHIPGDIPVVRLNFIVLSLEGPFNREIVEGCVRETLLFFSQSIAHKQNVEFTFKGIGVLIIRDNKVKMKFYKDFLQAMDGSGNLLKALANRPGTGDSVLSSKETTATLSRNVVLFPRMEMKDMETIAEEDEKSSKEKEQSEKENSKKENLSPKRLLCRQSMSPAKVTGVCLTEELEKNFGKAPPPRPAAPVSELKPEKEAVPIQVPAQVPAPQSRTPSPLCQDHGRAGQEMCYLCMQRAQRNIPVYLNEEKRRKEKEEERILAQYLALKDQDALQKQQIRALASREQNQKIAAFNLGVAEALRSQKNEKAPETYKSYIFEKRPLSATPHQKQELYSQQLAIQLGEKTTREAKLKQDQDLVDRLEQVHLAEELAAQRAKYLKDRTAEMQCYKKALDSQIKMKPAPLPHCEPNSNEAIFGKNDLSKEKVEERRKRSQEFSRHQLQAAADRKRAAILSQLIEQRRAEEMIQRARKQWIAEKGARLERIFQMNLAVKDDWKKSAGLKRQRDYEEKLFQRAGDKLFLLDQCAKYRRCYQCKRRLSGCGDGNEWTDNKYVPGSRLMV
ncbi:PREDICTED: coiled-coil domain-containing protein 81 [Gekko japonicus]|uniref:Coiled-coil domain-containing protein 81 n=1 Tax=Gekko japonicus TaxID=146911 RepID=A0ABM1LB71_GEKJA|nr:PREDICTED: coiled-coil domain-containing protein 81 [Gekko japonicus]